MTTVNFQPQRTAQGKAIFAPQFGVTVAPAIPLTASGATIVQARTSGGIVLEALVFIDEPAPRSRCIIMDYQNRTIRL